MYIKKSFGILIKIKSIEYTCRDPSIDGRMALIKFEWPRFFDFLNCSCPIQLCRGHCLLPSNN